MTATAVSLPASTRSRQYSAEKQSIGSASPHAPCGKLTPHSPDSRKWVCTSTTTSRRRCRGRRGRVVRGRRRRLLRVGGRRLRHGEATAGLGARRTRTARRCTPAGRPARTPSRPTRAGSAGATSRGGGRGRRRRHGPAASPRARRSSSGGGRYSPFEHGHSFSGSPGSTSSCAPTSSMQPRLRTRVCGSSAEASSRIGVRAASSAAGSGGGHERLADEDGVVAGVGEAAGVGGVADARLGDLDDAVGDRRGHPRGPVVVDLERHEVALVDADQRGAALQGDLQLRLVVDLDEHVEAELDGELVELDQLEAVERGGDQQHGVGAHQPGVGDVVRGDREVLAQHGQRGRRPGRLRGRRPSRRRTPRR